MKKMKKRSVFGSRLFTIFLIGFLASLPVIFGAAPLSAGSADNFVNLEIIHTNDTHGCFQNCKTGGLSEADAVTRSKDAIYGRKDGSFILLLDSGDILDKDDSDPDTMTSDLERMSKLGYDAVALGNHDVVYGIENLKERSAALGLPVLCANLVYKESGDFVFEPYIVKNVGGIRIGILGLTTTETADKMSKEDKKAVRVIDPEDAYSKIIDKFKNECDVRILLSHMGTDEDEKFAKKHQKMKVIIGGHTPDALKTPLFVNTTCIVNTGRFAMNIGHVDIKLEQKNFEVKNIEGDLKRIDK